MSKRSTNSPHPVRTSFLDYLKHNFMHRENWVHPVLQVELTHLKIESALNKYKSTCPENYKALWRTWTTRASRAFIADNFNVSSSTLKRQCDQAVDIVLLFVLFPTLEPDHLTRLYQYPD